MSFLVFRIFVILTFPLKYLGNEAEALAYATAHSWTTTSISEIALKISQLPKKNTQLPRLVIFTQGADETIVAQNGTVKTYPIIPVAAGDIVDTNGCGDAWVGGFMSQYVQGKSIATCCAAGAYVASVVIKRSGPTYPKVPHGFKE